MKIISFVVASLFLIVQESTSQDPDFADMIKNFVQGNEESLKNIQDTYSALPQELRQKVTDSLLANALNSDLLSNLGPALEGMLKSKASVPDESIETNEIPLSYNEKPAKKHSSSVEKLINRINPELISTVLSIFSSDQTKGRTKFSWDMLAGLMLGQSIDIDSLVQIGINYVKTQRLIDNEYVKELKNQFDRFKRSSAFQKINKLFPKILKSESFFDAFKMIEREANIRVDVIISQLEKDHIRRQLARELTKYFTESHLIEYFLRSYDMNALKDSIDGISYFFKDLFDFDEFLANVVEELKSKLQIEKSIYDLSRADAQEIITKLIDDEVFLPITEVYRKGYSLVIRNKECANFIYCQMNRQSYLNDSFIKRHFVKVASIFSAFQIDDGNGQFSKFYEAIYRGDSGLDCQVGVKSHCLELLDVAAHNEL